MRILLASAAFCLCAVAASAFTPELPASPTLLDSTLRIDEVVVTGSNDAVGRDLLPYTVSVIGNSRIESSGGQQLLSAVSGQVPSLFVTERNIFGFGISTGGSGGIKIRGVGGSPTNAVLMMVDGQPQFAGIYSHPVADAYESEYVDHVEILSGPASVLYGSNAMGGVINVITKNPDQGGVHTTISSQYGSYNTLRSNLTSTTRFGNFSSLVSLSYDSTDGVKDGFDFKQGSAFAKLALSFGSHWKARTDFTLENSVGNDPVYATLSKPGSTDIYHQDITRGAASLSADNDYGSLNGSIRTYYSFGDHDITDPKAFKSTDDRFGILAYENFSPWGGAAATAGFDFDRYTGKIGKSGGNDYSEEDTPMGTMGTKSITEFSPYATLSQSLLDGIFVINAGLRVAISDRFGITVVPQGGFVVRPGADWIIKGSIAKGYRNPSFRELYLYRTATSELRPENMLNYELGAGKTFSRFLDLTVTGYLSNGSNMIQIVEMKNVNTGSFTNKGIELSLSSRPLDNLSLKASYSYLHTSLEGLTGAPRHQYYIGADWRATDKLRVNLELKGIEGLYVAEDIDLQDYALLNARVSYQVIRQLEIFVAGCNLTDARYVINRGYPLPGINAMAGFKLRF